jgi:formylglycine-generating enzyme required for sulfatase activity
MPPEGVDRLRAALAAMAPEDPARQAFETLVQQAGIHGPIVTGGVSSGGDANIGTIQIFNLTPPVAADPHTIRLAWLDRLARFYGESVVVMPGTSADLQPLLDDLRLRLASGVQLWTSDPPAAQLTDLEARSRIALVLLPLSTAPLTYGPWRALPIRWTIAAEAIFGSALTHLVVELQREFRQSTREAFNLRLLNALAQPQYRAGIQRLLADLRDPARGGAAIAANRLARQASPEFVLPAAVAQATQLRLLAAGAAGALAGAGTVVALDLAAHHGDTVLNLLRQLVEQLEPSAAHAAEQPAKQGKQHIAKPDHVRIPASTLSIPISIAQWRDALSHRDTVFGHHGLRAAPMPYWCYMPDGRYRIGGWRTSESVAIVRLTSFWIARFPVTVAQYTPFVAQGYGPGAERWWTAEGWRWKQAQRRSQPDLWDDPRTTAANQPVIGVTWYEAMAFCAWLNEQLAGQLPQGYLVRLPSEAEWEAAASYAPGAPRRTYPWGEPQPTPERAIYDASGLDTPAPVGCCPAGAAACGALDMAGNVWERCGSSHKSYPIGSAVMKEDFTYISLGDVPVRGGAYYSGSTSVRCGARGRYFPDFGYVIIGFRLVVAPRSH